MAHAVTSDDGRRVRRVAKKKTVQKKPAPAKRVGRKLKVVDVATKKPTGKSPAARNRQTLRKARAETKPIEIGGVAVVCVKESAAAEAIGISRTRLAQALEGKLIQKASAVDEDGVRWFSADWLECMEGAFRDLTGEDRARLTLKEIGRLYRAELDRRGVGA